MSLVSMNTRYKLYYQNHKTLTTWLQVLVLMCWYLQKHYYHFDLRALGNLNLLYLKFQQSITLRVCTSEHVIHPSFRFQPFDQAIINLNFLTSPDQPLPYSVLGLECGHQWTGIWPLAHLI